MRPPIHDIVASLTLEEKASLCSGESFWTTKAVERLGIPSIMLTDGPHGLRKQAGESDHLGLNASVPATCFPSAVGMASSWSRDLVRRIGTALGEECQAEGVSVLLGPGANIKRSPLCGRNFEYFSEDPYLTGEMAASHIEGVQSQGVGTSLKHFAVNNQEHRRMTTDAVVDERTLREIYLTGFETAVKKSQPWTVMSAYNKLNGTYCSENETLLTRILKEEWGHEGIVVSDWGAVNEAVASVSAGMELEMPSSHGEGQRKIVTAVKSGQLSEESLDRSVDRLLSVIFKAVDNRRDNASYDADAHHRLAREAARETMVLLKNEDGLLPLPKSGNLAIVGAMAEKVRYQGGGSSHINPTKLDDIREEIGKSAGGAEIGYAQGYLLDSDDSDEALLEEAKKLAATSDSAVLFVGLTDRYESEGYDRTHLNLPANQIRLIEEIASVQPNVVVVLSNGAPVVMPWVGRAKTILEAYLGGQAAGGAIADLLFGDANPSGKLAETFPINLKHNPSHPYFPGEGDRVEYREGIFVGYRYYDAKEIEPLFPFGYGLSYTTFAYSDLELERSDITDRDTLQVRVTITNKGDRFGQEIVQLYVRDVESAAIRPEKELKGFVKVALDPGEAQTVSFTLDKRSFAYYDAEQKDWHVETGEYEVLIGGSSRDIHLKASLNVRSTTEIVPSFHRNTTLGELMSNPATIPILAQLQSIAPSSEPQSDAVSSEMMMAMMRYMPLRALLPFIGGAMTEDHLAGLLVQLNAAVQAERNINDQPQTEESKMSFTENSKLEELLANEAATAVLEKHLPGISTNPMANMGKGFTLKQLGAIPQANISQEILSSIITDFAGMEG
jgi:beta-glucosidase